eukprot:scaffold391247_cov24-Prasinocladus_malaysianus.AAC.1
MDIHTATRIYHNRRKSAHSIGSACRYKQAWTIRCDDDTMHFKTMLLNLGQADKHKNRDEDF